MPLAYVALGSNLGDRRATLDAAIQSLRDTPAVTVEAVSAYLDNPAADSYPGAPDFLNAAARLRTTLPPHDLLAALQQIEQNLGRRRDPADRNAPRTLDLDLLLYGDLALDTPALTIPHPRMLQRPFVMKPLAQVRPKLPGAVHSPAMDVTATIRDARLARQQFGRLALVPTMGALHAGHLSLIDEARRRAPAVAVSLFVNPTQFNNADDLARYPRPVEKDLDLLKRHGVDFVFHPAADEIYPPDFPKLLLDVPDLTDTLEGKFRPGHFRGVCTVVAKLLNILTPDVACFGRKDFQQLRVIETVAAALDFGTEIVGCPTVRDADGLALSSRNARLTPDQRKRAASIPRSLQVAADLVKSGVRQTNRLAAAMRNTLMDVGNLGHVRLSVDYVAAVDPRTLKPHDMMDGPLLLAVAARVGETRLIDNAVVTMRGERV